jgi:transposase
MLGKKERAKRELFYLAGSIEDLIPEDHVLKRVNRILSLSWLRDEVKELYCEDNGRPGIDPESAVRLMLAGFLLGIVHDRELMREAQVHLGIRWFAGYRLDEVLPDHSSLTRIRQRWGEEKFREIFERTVKQCVKAGLVKGDLVHVDATLIRADVSWESLVERHVEKVTSENEDDGGDDGPKGRTKKVSETDPDATMATSRKDYRLEPSYKQHTAVDDEKGVIVDVEVTTGEECEGKKLAEQIERVEKQTGKKVETATADGAYANAGNYLYLERRGTQAIIPPQARAGRGKGLPSTRFRYDAKNGIVKCPRNKTLRASSETAKGVIYRGRAKDCGHCPLREKCVPRTGNVRTIAIVRGYEALQRARRKRQRWDEEDEYIYRRHRWRAEGVHGEAKERHGMRRAVRRGLWNVAVQAYLAAAAMNLKRLAASILLILLRLYASRNRFQTTDTHTTATRRNLWSLPQEFHRAA